MLLSVPCVLNKVILAETLLLEIIALSLYLEMCLG